MLLRLNHDGLAIYCTFAPLGSALYLTLGVRNLVLRFVHTFDRVPELIFMLLSSVSLRHDLRSQERVMIGARKKTGAFSAGILMIHKKI